MTSSLETWRLSEAITDLTINNDNSNSIDGESFYHGHLDCFSGAAGDMILASCFDAANSIEPNGAEQLCNYISTILKLGLPDIANEFDISYKRVWRGIGSIAAIHVQVTSIYGSSHVPVPKPANAAQQHNFSTRTLDDDNDPNSEDYQAEEVGQDGHIVQDDLSNSKSHRHSVKVILSNNHHHPSHEHTHDETSYEGCGVNSQQYHSHDHSHHETTHLHQNEISTSRTGFGGPPNSNMSQQQSDEGNGINDNEKNHSHNHSQTNHHSDEEVQHNGSHSQSPDHNHQSSESQHNVSHTHTHGHHSTNTENNHIHSHHSTSTENNHTHSHYHHHHHHHQNSHTKSIEEGPIRNLPEIRRMLESDEARKYFPEWVRSKSIEAFTVLAQAEASVHGASGIDDVHFHEVGAIDSIVDMVGSVLALHALHVKTFSCSALPIGEGMVRTAHGILPVPTPATLYLMKGMPTCPGPPIVTGELVTPTGAALIRVLAHTDINSTTTTTGIPPGRPPRFTLRHIGIGAGTKDFQNHPNILRLLIGDNIVAK